MSDLPRLSECRDCHDPIRFVRMVQTGKHVPVDPLPHPQGTIVARLRGGRLEGFAGLLPSGTYRDHPYRFRTHFATCEALQTLNRPKPPEPDPALFRRAHMMKMRAAALVAATAGVLTFGTATAAQAQVWDVSHTVVDDGQAQNPHSHMRVKMTTNDVGLSGGSIRATDVAFTVIDGCANFGGPTPGYTDMVFSIYGQSGVLKYRNANVDVGTCVSPTKILHPNVVIGENAYWRIDNGWIGLAIGDRCFGDCWRVHPAKFTAPHPECAFVNLP